MNYKYILIAVFVVLISCQNEPEIQNDLIVLENALEYNENNISFKDFRFVKLENNRDAYFGENIKMKTYNNEIYIMEMEDQRALFHFDGNGDFMNKIGQKGRGPEEYNALYDFSIRNDTVYLLGRSDKIFIYSYLPSGDFINKTEIPQRAINFERLPDNHFLMNSQYAYGTENRLFTMTEKGEILKGFLPKKKDSKFDFADPGNGLYQSDEAIILCEAYNDTIYSFENNELIPKYLIDFGSLTNSEVDVEEIFNEDNNFQYFSALQKRGMANIRRCYDSSDYLLLIYFLQKEGEKTRVFYFLYNKHQKSVSTLIFEEESSLASNFLGFTNQSELVFILYPYGNEIDELKQLFPDINIPNLTETENAMLVFCKL